jgi:sugar O-acyltransferase (sialic acid O-acetyltransferase NeuD family)
MKNVLAIIGAGILGQHIAHYAKFESKFISIVFFDDTLEIGSENNYGKVKGKISDIDKCIKKDEIQNLLIGIGYKHLQLRRKLYAHFRLLISLPNIIHPSCYIDPSAQIGNGNVFLPGCIIDKGCVLGSNNFFNPGCIIAHDSTIGDHSCFGAGIKISGLVKIGSCCFFGTGTNTIDNITIGDNIMTGAGTLITKSISDTGMYIGNPGRQIK